MNVEISKTRLEELEKAELKLQYLHIYGVDNWEGYGLAMTEYVEENEEN